MSFYTKLIQDLQAGQTVQFRPSGNSMTGKVNNKQLVTVSPSDNIQKGDIVLCKVKGRIYLHLVTGVDGDRYQISNNFGHVNGWTRTIYGKCIKVDD